MLRQIKSHKIWHQHVPHCKGLIKWPLLPCCTSLEVREMTWTACCLEKPRWTGMFFLKESKDSCGPMQWWHVEMTRWILGSRVHLFLASFFFSSWITSSLWRGIVYVSGYTYILQALISHAPKALAMDSGSWRPRTSGTSSPRIPSQHSQWTGHWSLRTSKFAVWEPVSYSICFESIEVYYLHSKSSENSYTEKDPLKSCVGFSRMR